MSVLYIQGLLLELGSIRPAKILQWLNLCLALHCDLECWDCTLAARMPFLQIYGTQSAVTKAFPTNH